MTVVVHSVYARFNGPTDTLLNCFNLGSTSGAAALSGFWHKDNAYYNSGCLMQEWGTWNPSQTGSTTANRPYDSYLTVGGVAVGTNTSNADPSWVNGGNADARSWNRPDLPNNGTLGWFNSNRTNLQGRVGTAPNTATDVRVAQFVLSLSDTVSRSYTLTIGYNDGVPGTAVQFGTANFTLPNPCSTVWYRDIDGDGLGSAADGTTNGCTAPAGYAAINGDNCRTIPNPDQADTNNNGLGDACELVRGDLNLDGIVNASDVPLFFNAWGSAGPLGDLNRDGIVNSADFTVLLGNWGTTP